MGGDVRCAEDDALALPLLVGIVRSWRQGSRALDAAEDPLPVCGSNEPYLCVVVMTGAQYAHQPRPPNVEPQQNTNEGANEAQMSYAKDPRRPMNEGL